LTQIHDGQAGFDARIREAVPMPVDDKAPRDGPRLGPDSLVWKFFGDWRVHVFGFQRVAGTENGIEQLAKAVYDHSVVFSDTLGRARRSAPPIQSVVYDADPHAWGRTVRDFHKTIKGTIDDGSRYHALNPELFYWGHATFVDQTIYTADTFIRRLFYAEKAQIFEESKTWYQHYGVTARTQPQTYDEFVSYWEEMEQRFTPNKTIRYGTGYIRKGIPGPKLIPKPVWKVISAPINAYTRTIVAGTLPPRLREVAGIDWDERRERNFRRVAAVIRALNPVFNRLPMRVLYTPWAAAAWERSGVDPRRIRNRAAP
jgi:uncharacterized protein (DUF2236 family)